MSQGNKLTLIILLAYSKLTSLDLTLDPTPAGLKQTIQLAWNGIRKVILSLASHTTSSDHLRDILEERWLSDTFTE